MSQTVLLVVVDQGVDLVKLNRLQKQGKIQLQQVRDIEQRFKNVLEHGQPLTIGVSTIGGPDMIADDNVNEVRNFFDKNQQNDFLHVYSAYLIHADYFITNDKTDFIAHNKREKLEQLMPGLKIRTVDECLAESAESQ
jgi:hypothetical protein